MDLTPNTIQANSRFFLNDESRVPTRALSVGIGTILDAQELLFLASGPAKAAAVARLTRPGVTTDCPLTALKLHPHATLLVDPAACAELAGTPKERLDALMQAAPHAEHWTLEWTEK